MEFFYSARTMEQVSEEYRSFRECGLVVENRMEDGDGSASQPFEHVIRITNVAESVFRGVIHVEIVVERKSPRFFLPAFLYGWNRGEAPQHTRIEFPRIRDFMQRPASPWWMVRSDRLACPAAFVFDQGHIIGFHTSPYFVGKKDCKEQYQKGSKQEFYQYGGFSCNLMKSEDCCSVGYTLGYENAPWMFVESHHVEDRKALSEENIFEIEPNETVEIRMGVYDYQSADETGINQAMERIYGIYHEKPRKAANRGDAIDMLSHAISKYAWLPEENGYTGFVYEDPKDGSLSYNKIGSLTWTNGLAVATPMLMAGLRLKDDKMRQQAVDCIQNIVDHSMNPASGFPYDAVSDGKWKLEGWWFDLMHNRGHASYLMGQAMYYILKAYEYEKTLHNCVHEDWMTFVKPVLAKMEAAKNLDAEYPYIFSDRTGAGIEYDSFAGTWCMAAIAYYSWMTGSKEYLNGLKESEQHYYDCYVSKMECYGTPLDTDKAVDSEGILAYIRAVRYLHQTTGGDCYLTHMKDALGYEFTFKFCYNSPIKVSPLSKVGWSSCGGSVTSVANPHIHPMSSTITDEMNYYVSQTGDTYVKQRLQDVLDWDCQCFNLYDKQFDYGKTGWMSERFCHCQGLLSEKYPDGTAASTWFCLMPWAGCSILEGLAGECYGKGDGCTCTTEMV